MGNSTAYDSNGDVPVLHRIPWGAIRKASLVANTIRTLAKITLNGITYDIGKQATEGLVVMGEGYSSVTFFLPDDRESVADTAEVLNIAQYLGLVLGDGTYAEIPAWDYFAAFVGNTLSDLAGNSDLDLTAIPYGLTMNTDNAERVFLAGTGDFSGISTAKDFFYRLYAYLDEDSLTVAKNSPLTDWIEEDGAVALIFGINPEGDGMSWPMWIGRK